MNISIKKTITMKSYFTFILIIFLSIQSCISQDGKFTGYATAIVNGDEVLKIETFGLAIQKKRRSIQKIQFNQ
jgi:hypothetical protein